MPLLHATPKWGQEKGKGKGEAGDRIARERSRSRDAGVATGSAAGDGGGGRGGGDAGVGRHDAGVDQQAGHRFEIFVPSYVPNEIIEACDRLPEGTTRLTREYADGGVKTIVITVTEWPPEDL
jgi:hypothetical protein